MKRQCHEQEHLSIVGHMCSLQVHRGPDDEGVLSVGDVCLGSNRLSIIDLSEAGHMPMVDEDTNWSIAYNGEVYNFKEIRDELISLGYQFRSNTDTEVVMRAFAHWGEQCVERFVGMFAFAIHNHREDTVTLVRDRFGKKPLYYACRNGHLLFASELKALTRQCDDLRPNRERLTEWSLFRNADFGARDTLFEGIYSLPAGHIMSVRRGRMNTPRCYYAPALQVEESLYNHLGKLSAQELTKDIESQLETSVRDRLVSDVPLGTLCSGGIDSSLITALCARHMKDVIAFNVSVPGYAALDESKYAKQVTDSLGIELMTLPMQAETFRTNLPRAIYYSDLPLTHPNSIAFLLISEFARQQGVKILLSGEGADELFGGYMHRYRRYRQFLRAQKVLKLLPAKVRKAIMLAGYACDNVPMTTFSEFDGLMSHAIGFLDRFSREDLRLRSVEAYAFVGNEPERAVLGAMLSDITNFLAPLLRRLDRMSMAASLECRVPFLDHRLTRTVMNLPLSYRLRGATDKWMLKEIASRHLPNNIVYRKKVGFPLPLGDYIGPLAKADLFRNGFCTEVLNLHQKPMMESVANWKHNVNGFYNLLALEIWGRMYFLKQTAEEVTEQIEELSGAAAPARVTGTRNPTAVSA